jgi:hypothetical protein
VIFPLHLLFRPFIAVDMTLFLDRKFPPTSDSLVLSVIYLALMIAFPLGVAQAVGSLAGKSVKILDGALSRRSAPDSEPV